MVKGSMECGRVEGSWLMYGKTASVEEGTDLEMVMIEYGVVLSVLIDAWAGGKVDTYDRRKRCLRQALITRKTM